MPTPYERTAPAAVPTGERPPLRRAVAGRRLAGVCLGVAAHLGLSTRLVRLTFIVTLVITFGASIAVYIFLWALVPEENAAEAAYRLGLPAPDRARMPVPAAVGVPGGVPGGVAAPVDPAGPAGPGGLGGPPPMPPAPPSVPPAASVPDPTAAVDARSRDNRWPSLVLVGALVIVIGLFATAQSVGIDVQAGLLIPLLVIAAGAMVAWSHLDEAERESWLAAGPGARRLVWARVGLGLGLAVVGILVLTTRGQSPAVVWDALLAALAVLAGAAIIAAPWVVRLWGDLRREQVAAARATERADIAAHLHDSVLQTLALIQRRSGDPVAVTQLARAQERELRTWLYAGPSGEGDSLAAAVAEVSHEVEDLHAVPIDLVVTGDRPLEPHGRALSRAMREALLNAVRHGRPPVTAYVEIGPSGVEAFVRDHGDGFDLDDVAVDRLGVRESILARMERHHGTARIRRRDDGIEVELTLPPIEGEQP